MNRWPSPHHAPLIRMIPPRSEAAIPGGSRSRTFPVNGSRNDPLLGTFRFPSCFPPAGVTFRKTSFRIFTFSAYNVETIFSRDLLVYFPLPGLPSQTFSLACGATEIGSFLGRKQRNSPRQDRYPFSMPRLPGFFLFPLSPGLSQDLFSLFLNEGMASLRKDQHKLPPDTTLFFSSRVVSFFFAEGFSQQVKVPTIPMKPDFGFLLLFYVQGVFCVSISVFPTCARLHMKEATRTFSTKVFHFFFPLVDWLLWIPRASFITLDVFYCRREGPKENPPLYWPWCPLFFRFPLSAFSLLSRVNWEIPPPLAFAIRRLEPAANIESSSFVTRA